MTLNKANWGLDCSYVGLDKNELKVIWKTSPVNIFIFTFIYEHQKQKRGP